MKAVALLLVLAVASCTSHQMAECKGPPFPMNAGAWQPTPEDLKL